jgi:hypothetical protein
MIETESREIMPESCMSDDVSDEALAKSEALAEAG